MAQAASRLSVSSLSVEQVANAINGMIAERTEGRLRKVPHGLQETLKPRDPGIYFGLPIAGYHSDPSLGSSNIKRLLQAPAVYW
jgi:hypothetical protein